jgi:septum formation protein
MIKLKYPLILGSKSPRRRQLLQDLGFEFKTVHIDTDESIPASLTPEEAAKFLAEKKARIYQLKINNEILLTADTVVSLDERVLGKPSDPEEARSMLKSLSGKEHEVITGICIVFQGAYHISSELTRVIFRELTESDIDYYVTHYKPLDKAGAYGIQEWIGMIGIESIYGSYFNVVGLPVSKVYAILKDLGLLVF